MELNLFAFAEMANGDIFFWAKKHRDVCLFFFRTATYVGSRFSAIVDTLDERPQKGPTFKKIASFSLQPTIHTTTVSSTGDKNACLTSDKCLFS
jgi:hypothetical protein